MKHIINSTLYKSLILISLFFFGCSSAGSGARVSDAPDPRLDTSATAPKELLSVNSLTVSEVSVPLGSKSITKSDATNLLSEAFRSNLEVPVSATAIYPHILSGEITSYQDRIGSSAGATQYAKVSIRVKISDRKSGNVLWQGSFSAGDESLTDNLFNSSVQTNSGTGVGFSSARDLLKRGFEETATSFAEVRLKAFTK